MKWDLVRAIIGKDFKEFKKNKYILYTLVTFPIIFSIVVPMSIIGPILAMGGLVVDPTDVPGPPTMAIAHDINQTGLDKLQHNLTQNETLMLHGYHIRNVIISNIILNGTWIENSTLDYVIIRHCRLTNVTIGHGQVYNTYLENSEILYGEISGSWGHNVTVTLDVAHTENTISDIVDPGAFKIQDFIDIMSSTVMMMFVLVPSATPAIISSFSIIGEKKARSLEPILATPISDIELLMGKVLASFIPTIIPTFAAYALFAILMQVLAGTSVGVNMAFTPILLTGVFVLAPLVCVLSIVANVFISSKVNDIRAAQQLGSLVVLPLIFLFMIPITGAATFGPVIVLAMALFVGIADAGLMWFTLKVFNRENILVNWS
jgi:ABC-2 type transport system permease protein